MAHDRREDPRCLAAPGRTETAARISVRWQRRIWGGASSGLLEITHHRASYAVVCRSTQEFSGSRNFGVRLLGSTCRAGHDAWRLILPSRPGEFHPEPLTGRVEDWSAGLGAVELL